MSKRRAKISDSPWLRRILENQTLLRVGGPGLIELNIAHDDWCALLHGKGDCNCEPDVSVRKDHRTPRRDA